VAVTKVQKKDRWTFADQLQPLTMPYVRRMSCNELEKLLSCPTEVIRELFSNGFKIAI
jgi:hypothetical protein